MHGTPDLPDRAVEPAEEDGTRRAGEVVTLAPWLEHLRTHLPIARDGIDPEGVHQVRVACARLRVALRLTGMRALRNDLDWLRDQAAPVRDLEVHLSREPPVAVAAWIESELRAARPWLVAAIEHPRVEGMLLALSLLPPIRRPHAEERLRGLVGAALARGEKALAKPDDISLLHALRGALRQVRFAAEWLGAPARRIIKVLDVLGAVADRLLIVRHLDAMAEQGAVPARYRRKIDRELRQRAGDGRAGWARAIPALEKLRTWTST